GSPDATSRVLARTPGFDDDVKPQGVDEEVDGLVEIGNCHTDVVERPSCLDHRSSTSAPEAMIKTVSAALAGFTDLPDYDRELLFETFRVWQDNDASVGGTAEVLHCHPNTVRHRLRRIENTPADPSRGQEISPNCV